MKSKKVKNTEVKEAMHHNNSNTINLPKRDKAKKVWMIVAIISLIALVALGSFGYMKIKDLNNKISDQQTQINDLNDKKKTLEDAAAAAAKAATDAAAKAVGDAVTSSDEQLIQAAKNHYLAQVNVKTVNAKVGDKSGDFAHVDVNFGEPGTGRIAIFKKVNGTWQYIYGGTQAPCSDVATLYGVPSGWYMTDCKTTLDS